MSQIKKITLQDIANACNLSRNTVSKVFNNRSDVPKATRDFVIQKAKELGYPVHFEEEIAPVLQNIALLTNKKPMTHNFGTQFITSFTDQICRLGYNLRILEINDDEYKKKILPSHFDMRDVSGIIAIELFDKAYLNMLCDLGLPLLSVDSYTRAPGDLMKCDFVFIENYASSIYLTTSMLNAGAKSVGFVGDICHCSSFLERWNGFQYALGTFGVPVNKNVCILADDSEPYGEPEWILSKLNDMPYMPDGFVCANDFIAIRVMQALQMKGLSVPDDVMVTGFDGSPESEVVSPPLTTSEIPSADIGRISADILIKRIKSPTLPYQCVFIKSTPVLRASVRTPDMD